MESKLKKSQRDKDKQQDAKDKSRKQLQELHTSEEQLLASPSPGKRKHPGSFPGELLADLNTKTLQEYLIKLKEENKCRGDRIAELEDYILKLMNLLRLAEPEFKGSEADDNQKILEEKLKEYVIQYEGSKEEAATLKKTLMEMEVSCHRLHFECDALKGKLASVRELESLDSQNSDEEGQDKDSAKAELLQRVKNLEGLLKLKDMSEKEQTDTIKDLEAQLLQSQENQRLLSSRCAKLGQLMKQKEDIEHKLEERYNQVEQLQIDKERSEEEYQEQIKLLFDEIKERDDAHGQLEAVNRDLLQKIEELAECRKRLELKTAKLKGDLEERVSCELKLKKQCSDLEKTVRDWEQFEQQMNEQFKRVEGKQNGKIKSLRKHLEEKDEALRKTLQSMEEMKQSAKKAESLVHERHEFSPEFLQEKAELKAELSRKTEAEIDQAGFIVKMRSRFEMELSAKSKELDHLKDEAEHLTEEIGELQEQQRQQKESERKLQERNRMLEELVGEMQEGETRNLQEKITRMEKLLVMKEESEEKFQARISNQDTLLKAMEETQGRLAQRNEELGVKQRGMSEELHRWKTKCSSLENFEREVKVQTRCQRDRIKELETTKADLEAKLQKKIREFDELDILKRKEQANITAELKKIEELEVKESICQAAKQNLEMQLKKRIKEIEVSEMNVKNLKGKLEEAEEKWSEIRKVETALQQEKKALETQLAKESQLAVSLEAMVKEECQQSQTLTGELYTKEAALRSLQEEHSLLLARIQDLEQDLEEAKKKRTSQDEWETNNRTIDGIGQRLEDFAQSEKTLKETISNFIKAEAALQGRIQGLEQSKQKLVDKLNELASKSQLSTTNDSQLTGRLRSLQISERSLRNELTEKERAEEILKGKVWRLQNQLRMKEDEMNKQSDYFEHYKQRHQHLMVKLREREQSLQNQHFKLEMEKIDLNALSIVLKSELQQVTAKFTKLEKAHSGRSKDLSEHDPDLNNMESCLLGGADQIKEQILILQVDLRNLLEKEEANNQEKDQLLERLQRAEDNESFLTHKLEDFRSRIHELKLSESSLQEQMEDLEEENAKLRKELNDLQEQENNLNVLEGEDKLENIVQDKSGMNTTSSQNSEIQLSSDVIPEEAFILEEDESSPGRYRDLKNSLTHLRSQLQNGDILFREELMQQKWTAVFDSARNKNTQTPSIGQCVQEAMILAKLASECACGYPKLSEAIKEGRLIPLLEANSCTLADLIQILRTGDVEKVRTVLQLPETQRELALLLDLEVGQLAGCALSSPLIVKQEKRQCGEALAKELDDDAPVPGDTITNKSQSDQLGPENQEIAKLNLLPAPKHADSSNSDAAECMRPNTPCSMKREPGSGVAKIVTEETIARLEAEVGELRAEKAEMDHRLQCVNNQLLEAAEEKNKLEDELYAAGTEVNHLVQKLEAIAKGKIQEEESMKNNLRKENEVLEKRNKELLNGIAKLESSQRDVEAEFEERSEESLQKMAQLEEDKRKMEDKFNLMQQENAKKLMECHQSIEKLSTQNGEMKGRLSEVQSKEITLTNVVAEMKEEVEQLMKENKHLLNKIKVENEKASRIHQTMHRLTGENESLLGKVKELENELEDYFTVKTAAQNKINQLENENTKLMNLKENVIKELKAQGDAEIKHKQGELKTISMQLSDDLLHEDSSCGDDRKMMFKAKQMCEVKQSKSLMEMNVELNDVLTETSAMNIAGRSNDYKTLVLKDIADDENQLDDGTRMIVEACCEENEVQLTSVEGKDSLENLLERAELELEPKHEEVDKTKAESVPVQSIGQTADFSSENIVTLQQQILTLNSQLKDQTVLERKLQESHFKLGLLQNQFDMKFKRLQSENAKAKLLIAPLKAKLSCLIQKCLCRNSLIIHLVRELYQQGFPNAGLIEEAEDMLNDTAILEYTHMFLSAHCQQGNMNNNINATGIHAYQGSSPCCPRYPTGGNQRFAESKSSLIHRSCVAIADYCPNPNMPQTVLPVLTLSAGDIVHVTGKADSHGMYPAEVNGRPGFVPVALVEEIEECHHVCTPHSDVPPSPRTGRPERSEAQGQQLLQAQCNNCQVASSEASNDSLSTRSASHSDAFQPSVSRLHNELEHSNIKALMQATEKVKEQLRSSKSAEQFYCISQVCSESPCAPACNCASGLKSRRNSGESDTHLGMSDRFALNLHGHSRKCPSGKWRPSKMAQEPPAPVDSVRIIGIVGQNGLLVDWEKPSMDEMGCSNGTFVQGYRIFIDREFYKSVTRSVCTKVVLEGLDLSVPFQVSVQTVGANGLVSGKVNVPFLNCQQHKAVSVQPRLTPTVQASTSSKLPEETLFLPTQSKWRKFIAVYDYNPLQDSPNIHPSRELAFKEGDIIWVFGKQRRDGFCEAEVNGRRGLVPICFLEDTSIRLPKTLKHNAPWSVSSPPGCDGMPRLTNSSEHLHKQNS
ncbi:uncharacterized protein C4orf50 homolog isoform X2 [Amblyraja radiata]|uniref:uncharacterized protein C4orf50 homolog isoform X2 n=1 Tax=Amblyraja radiata TaxID=386614 RepID=UPI0014026967|nr:uncharacterized protein C4orf50 homolog isoform X2 [Amblyraja radiata]